MKPYILTQKEFKEIFKLDDSYEIPTKTLKQYTQYVIGSYKLYNELLNIHKKKPIIITFKGKKEKIVVYSIKQTGWQEFVHPLGNRMKLEAEYIDSSRYKDGSKPFWTYTKFNEDVFDVFRIAYSSVKNMLIVLGSKYVSKYQIQMTWRMKKNSGKNSEMMEPISLDGCDFKIDLEIMDGNGMSRFISDYDIKQTITNREDIWTGKILAPVKKIIETYETNQIQSLGHQTK